MSDQGQVTATVGQRVWGESLRGEKRGGTALEGRGGGEG